MEKISVKALALGLGAACSFYMLFLGWMAAFFNWGNNLVEVISSIYIGFEPTLVGGIIGAIWGFADGAIGGAIIAFVYNIFASKK